MYYHKRYISVRKFMIVMLILCCFGVRLELSMLIGYVNDLKNEKKYIYNEDLFRAIKISNDCIDYLIKEGKDRNEDYIAWITLAMLEHDYDLSKIKKEKKVIKTTKKNQELRTLEAYTILYPKYNAIFSDLVYFPIPVDLKGKETVSFDNSWMGERSYGGTRFHEGTDIMTSNNVRGYFPVLSISAGVVEQKGWLEKGGYRIGIRAPGGAYFYYAHMYSYAANLEKGDTVRAGELLGFMGDTGYSKVEGTTGNFDVHLHLGIYLDTDEGEISVNPYWVLKYLENYKLEYNY